jgi:flagellar basal-body rod modification protein FlgD
MNAQGHALGGTEMDAVSATRGSSDLTAASTANATTNGQAVGQDTFLKLLTTQMQNQDPLSPMDNEAFVAQLAQFSSLEQLMGVQKSLESIYLGIASMNNASMADLLGAEVVALGDSFAYDGSGPTELHYDADTAAADATLTVYDADGSVVYAGAVTGGVSDGEGTVTWNGKRTDGGTAAEGTYRFEITAKAADGTDVDVTERVIGTIDEMDYSSGTPMPSIEGVPLSLADVVRIRAAGT